MKPVVEFAQVSKCFHIEPERPRSLQERFVQSFRRRRSNAEQVWVLRDISFEIAPGASVGVVGQNGAGKSTLLKLCARVLDPTAGTVRSQGRVSALLELGVGFHPELTGRENVFLYGSLMGISRAVMRQRFDEIVAFSEIERFIDMPIKVYSSGMYLRLAFATAIHVEADILLLDEVFAVGDARFQQKCLERIQILQRKGVALLFVSHSAELVRQMCSQALWIEDGRLVAFDEADHVVTAYMEQLAFAGAQEKLHKDTHRWGTREVEITRVEFLDHDGRPCQRFRTSETFTTRLHYLARRRIEHPTFGVAIYRNDDIHINGPNTHLDEYDIPFVEGAGSVDYRVEHLNLLPGAYELSAVVYDQGVRHPFDHQHRIHPFWIDSHPAVFDRWGTVYLPGSWSQRTEQTGRGDG